MGINENGKLCHFSSPGNPYSHIVLRGSDSNSNYDIKHLDEAFDFMKKSGHLFPAIIDCSHANSFYKYENQKNVFKYVFEKDIFKTYPIIGLMLESHIKEGKQSFIQKKLDPEISVTDGCIGFAETIELATIANTF